MITAKSLHPSVKRVLVENDRGDPYTLEGRLLGSNNGSLVLGDSPFQTATTLHFFSGPGFQYCREKWFSQMTAEEQEAREGLLLLISDRDSAATFPDGVYNIPISYIISSLDLKGKVSAGL